MDIREQIEAAKIIAILRGNYLDAIRPIVEGLVEGGIYAVEITLNSPGALDAIQVITAEYGDKVLVGAGTVLEPAQVAQVAKAGGKYIISPAFLPDVIKASLDQGLEPIPGTLTPTEIIAAYRAGARLIKWFPALGPDYLRALRGPYDFIRFIPTGTVNETNIRAYFAVGAAAVGIGSALVRSGFDGSPVAITELTARARRLTALVGDQSVTALAAS